jgi:hypothetical protein
MHCFIVCCSGRCIDSESSLYWAGRCSDSVSTRYVPVVCRCICIDSGRSVSSGGCTDSVSSVCSGRRRDPVSSVCYERWRGTQYVEALTRYCILTTSIFSPRASSFRGNTKSWKHYHAWELRTAMADAYKQLRVIAATNWAKAKLVTV